MPLIHNGLARLETCLLKRTFARFQRAMNVCLKEREAEMAQAAIRNFQKNLKECLFFNEIPEYPISVKESINQEIKENVVRFRKEYLRYLKKLSYVDNDSFVSDLIYICGKMKSGQGFGSEEQCPTMRRSNGS